MTPFITPDSKQKELRTAIALNRGIELLEAIQREPLEALQKEPINQKGKPVLKLEKLFYRIHGELFKDWESNVATKPGEVNDPEKLRAMREAIRTILCANGDDPKGLFDSNWFAVWHSKDHLADIFATFYTRMREIAPYDYGNKLALDFFMMALTKLPSMTAKYGREMLDFRRLDQADLQVFYDCKDKAGIKAAFLNAMDGQRSEKILNDAPAAPDKDPDVKYTPWDKHVEEVGEVPFLSHMYKGELCLVTVKGGLVPLALVKEKLEKHFLAGGLASEFPPIDNGALVGQLPGAAMEALAKEDTDVDGIRVTEDAAPLLCTDIDLMTGLRPAAHDIIMGLIGRLKNENGKPLILTDLNEQPQYRDQLLALVKGDMRKEHMVRVAYDHVNRNVKNLMRQEAEIFKHATPVENPMFFITMGSAGSGKSSVKKIAADACQGNFVEASLDEFRNKSKLYNVLIAAGHHADDYITVEPYANALRDWVADTARRKHYNLLYDGSGITYKGRYDRIAKSFKDSGYRTELVAVDAPVRDAIKRVNERARNKLRAMPWITVMGKQAALPASFLQAVQDPSLDKVSLLSADTVETERGLVAETFEGAPAGGFADLLLSGDSVFSRLKSAIWQVKDSAEALAKFFPDLTPQKTARMHFTLRGGERDGKSRLLAIYDAGRLAATMEKGLLDAQASAPQYLTKTPESLSFYMPDPASDHPGAWQVRLLNQPAITKNRS